MSTQPKKILILALSGIGNFLMQSPVFKAIKKTNPTWHITVWVAPRGTKELAKNNPYIDEVIQAPIKNPALRHLKQVRRLQAIGADAGIVLSPGQLWKSAAYLYLANIPQRIGNSFPFRGDAKSEFLLTDAVLEQDNIHDIEQNLQLLKPLGIKDYAQYYALTIPESNQKKAKHILTNIPEHNLILGIHAGSAPDFRWKRWPLDNFIEVASSLTKQHNAHILLFGGPDEQHMKDYIQTELGKNASSISENLLTTAAIMKHCSIFLSNDSGLMHLAAAVGTKTFGLFGPTDERKTGPRGSNSYVIRAPETDPVYDTEQNYDLGKNPHTTILAITPEYVTNIIRKSLTNH